MAPLVYDVVYNLGMFLAESEKLRDITLQLTQLGATYTETANGLDINEDSVAGGFQNPLFREYFAYTNSVLGLMRRAGLALHNFELVLNQGDSSTMGSMLRQHHSEFAQAFSNERARQLYVVVNDNFGLPSIEPDLFL